MTTHSKHLINKTKNILGNLGVRFPRNKKYKNKKPQIDSKKKNTSTKTIRTHCVYLVNTTKITHAYVNFTSTWLKRLI